MSVVEGSVCCLIRTAFVQSILVAWQTLDVDKTPRMVIEPGCQLLQSKPTQANNLLFPVPSGVTSSFHTLGSTQFHVQIQQSLFELIRSAQQ